MVEQIKFFGCNMRKERIYTTSITPSEAFDYLSDERMTMEDGRIMLRSSTNGNTKHLNGT